MNERLQRLRKYLADHNSDFEGFFITKPENRAYLSNFTGSFGYLFVTSQDSVLFTDGRYVEQAALQAPEWRIVRLQRPFEETVVSELKKLGVKSMGFEADNLNYADYMHWTAAMPNTNWLPTEGVIAHLRWRKDLKEQDLIRQAVNIASNAFEDLLNILKPGMTERDAASELEFLMRKFGADSLAFDTIVASGTRGALPHGRATTKVLEKGELITFDFGARFEGYNSDITRTVSLGHPNEKQRQIYELVLETQQACCEAVKPGVPCREVDAISRKFFDKAGMLDKYLHSLGHNLGREVHETPFLTPPDPTPIEEGMVLTVEPGLYINNWGGVRIEDDLLVTANGAEVLSKLPKHLIVI